MVEDALTESLRRRSWRTAFLGACALWLMVTPATADEPDAFPWKVRVEWGGGPHRQWQGHISVSEGSIVGHAGLGVEADSPGTMWIDSGELVVRQPGRRYYDGVDLELYAPSDARLLIDLSASDEEIGLARVEVSLSTLASEVYNSQLDEQNNRLVVRRAPGDLVPVEIERDHLVFDPGEALDFSYRLNRLPVAAQTRLRLRAQLTRSGEARELWAHEENVEAPDAVSGARSLTCPLPREEGVYDLQLSVIRGGLRGRLEGRKPVALRRVQVVVVSPTRPAPASVGRPPQDELLAIDPVHPAWWERLPAWPGARKGPWKHGSVTAWEHPTGTVLRLGAWRDGQDPSWAAYPLTVSRPGEPHVLEVEYPADLPQALAISLIEPNSAGEVAPLGVDSGLYMPDSEAPGDETRAQHRIVFWPRTRAPVVRVVNRNGDAPAAFGKIRLLGPKAASRLAPISPRTEPAHLPALISGQEGGRLLAGFYDRPLFAENFSAPETLDAAAGRSLEDWQTFFLGGKRLIEYLAFRGSNGLVLSVVADGGAIYPSRWLEATPRYDTGVFSSLGQDPLRKDTLELLFRLFDREGMVLIPAVHFTTPLPELEALIRDGGPQSVGVELVGADGQPWLATHRPRQGLAPYYNPLHDRVQQAMTRVVAELQRRYAHHPSYGGLAIAMSAEGYAQFPGGDWGFDPATIGQFALEAGIVLPSGSGRLDHQRRVELIRGTYRAQWLRWRAEVLTRFYGELAKVARGEQDSGKLYLSMAGALDRPELARYLRPGLPSDHTPSEALVEAGIDARSLAGTDGVVLVRARRLAPLVDLAEQAVNLRLNDDGEFDALCQGVGPAANLFYHEPQEMKLPSFDTQGPFARSKAWLVSQPIPEGLSGRSRFVHALATVDCQAIFDGGWLLPLGQDDQWREIASVFRRLPAAPFEALPQVTPPVTIRTFADREGTWIYFVNDSPWSCRVQLDVSAVPGSAVESVGRKIVLPDLRSGTAAWRLDLAPYDLIAAWIGDTAARFDRPAVEHDREVVRRLDARITDLWDRAATLREGVLKELVPNAGFDEWAQEAGVPGWEVGLEEGATVVVDEASARNGGQCVRMSGGEQGASLTSKLFAPPSSGRLRVSAWLRTTGARPPDVKFTIKGDWAGQEYVRVAAFGDRDKLGQREEERWRQVRIEFPDLPLAGLGPLEFSMELVGSGTVWVDDLEFTDLVFSKAEVQELANLLRLAERQLERGELAQCASFLESYWPRFLLSEVDASRIGVARQPPPLEPMPAKAEPPGLFERMRDSMPSWLR